MRLKILSILLAFIVSCKLTGNKNNLLGFWTTDYDDKAKYPNNNILDKLTFWKGDSLNVDYFIDGKLHESHSGHYSFDKQKMVFTTKYDTANFKFEVLSLTKDKFAAKQISANNRFILKRL